MFRTDRNRETTGLSAGGGVLIAVSNKFRCRRRPDLEFNDGFIESCFIEIELYNCSFIIGNHYFQPKFDAYVFEKYCDFIKDKCIYIPNLVLLGDFNLPGVNWMSKSVESVSDHYVKIRATHMLDAVSYLNLAQIYDGYVAGSLLDLVFTNYFNFYCTYNVSPLVPIDNYHPPFCITLQFYVGCPLPSQYPALDFQKGNYLSLYVQLSSFDWSPVISEPNVNVAASNLSEIINNVISNCIPTKIDQ